MAVRLYWCEEHFISAGFDPEPVGCVIGFNIWTESGGLYDPGCRIVPRLLVDPSSLPEHAVEAAARALHVSMAPDWPMDNCRCREHVPAAIRGFLESLSEEDK